MSAGEVSAVIAGSVNLLKFTEALARAGIVGRFDSDRRVLVLEPARKPERNSADALTDMAVYNGWTKAERMHWHTVARSSVPADAWEAYKREGRA